MVMNKRVRGRNPRRHAAVVRLAAVLSLLVAGSCENAKPEAAAAPRVREIVAVRWSTLWRAGGPEQDTALLFPIGLIAADSQHVYVPDAGGVRIAAFRTRDGSLAWTFGRRGRGPGEFSGFTAIALNDRGQIVIADAENARLTILGVDGRLIREIPLDGLPRIESVCPLPGEGYLVATSSSTELEPIMRLSRTGSVTARYAVPWEDLREAPGIQRQLHMTPAGGDGCVLALKLGRGFSIFRDNKFSTHAYVEPLPLPDVEVATRELKNGGRSRGERLTFHQVGPSGASASGDSLVLPFIGRTSHAGRVVDIYDLAHEGTYIGSYLLPGAVDAAVKLGDVFFVLRSYKGYPALYAVQMRRDSLGH